MQDSAYTDLLNNKNESKTSFKSLKDIQKHYKLNLGKKNLNENSKEITTISEINSDIILCNLSYNNLTTLPDNLLSLKNLITLDLRKNDFKDINQIIEFISKYKYLTDLKIDFSNSSQVQTLLSKNQNLLYINGKSTEDYINPIDINKDLIDSISIEKKLPEFNDLFVIFQNNFQNENQEELSKDLYDKFQNLINEEANKVNESNSGANLPNYCIANNIIKSEVNLLKFFINSFLEHSELLKMENSKKDIGQKTNDILNLLFTTFSKIIDELHSKIDSVNKIKNKKIELLLEYLNDNSKNNSNNGEKINNINDEYEKLKILYNKEKEIYNLKIEKLQKENQLITDSLIKKGIDLSMSSNNINLNNSNITSKKSHNENNKNEILDATLLGLSGAKILTKKQMHDLINELYDSKIEYDRICNENHLKKESMEQYMYKFLNNKYGLKNLVIEWSSSIITGIKMYSSTDSEINLFSKIIKNKIEEGQRAEIIKLKSTIKDLYDTQIKNKSRLASNKNKNKLNEKEIENILNSFNENILLNEDEWKNIIKSIYNEDEYKILTKYIINKIIDKNDKEKKNYINNLKNKKKSEVTREDLESANKKKFPKKITYKEFENILIGYQVTYREKYLSNLHKLFIKYDEDSTGVLNEKGFKKLLNSIDFIKKKGKEYMTKLLYIIDPHSYNNITFTEIVNLFSKEMVTNDDDDGLTMNFLDKLGLEEPANLNLE